MTRTRKPVAYAEDSVMNTGEWLLLAWLVHPSESFDSMAVGEI
jgi:hypothetical protein